MDVTDFLSCFFQSVIDLCLDLSLNTWKMSQICGADEHVIVLGLIFISPDTNNIFMQQFHIFSIKMLCLVALLGITTKLLLPRQWFMWVLLCWAPTLGKMFYAQHWTAEYERGTVLTDYVVEIPTCRHHVWLWAGNADRHVSAASYEGSNPLVLPVLLHAFLVFSSPINASLVSDFL